MKNSILSLVVSLMPATGFADTPIPVDQLPGPVLHVVEEYFPGSRLVMAQQDSEDGRVVYEMKIHYKEIELEVETSAEGAILDVEMEGRVKL